MSLLSLFPIFRCVSTVFRVTKPLIFLSRFCHFCHTHLRESGRHTCLLTSGAPGSAARMRNKQKRHRLSASFTMPAHNAKSPRLWRGCPEGAGEVCLPFFFSFHVAEYRNVLPDLFRQAARAACSGGEDFLRFLSTFYAVHENAHLT